MEELLFWSLIDFIFLSLILFILLPYIKKPVYERVKIIRRGIDKNEGFFSIFFVCLFTLEQMLLLYLIHKFGEKIDMLKLFVSFFALVVVATASFQKTILEIKRRYDKEKYIALIDAKKVIMSLKRFLEVSKQK